jgi:membrane protein DedA with SNARE-associated domain
MATILSALLSFLLVYKYIGLFVVAFLAALALPLPASTILAAAGAFAAQGYFSIYTVLGVAFLGNITGDVIGYFVAHRYGVVFLRKIGFEKILASKLYRLLNGYMEHFSYSLIFFSRFLTGVGPLVNILSGITSVRYGVFFGIGVLGEAVYVLLYGLVGYFLGSEWENNASFFFEATGVIVMLGITVSVVQYGLFKRMKRETKKS